MDQAFGSLMQKPRFGDPSGLSDTMRDLIFDAAGASLISGFGWWYMAREKGSFIRPGFTNLSYATGIFSAANGHFGLARGTATPPMLRPLPE